MMASLNQSIIALNSKAVGKICQGEYQDATMLLGRALRRIKERMLDSETELHQPPTDADEPDEADDFTLRSYLVELDMEGTELSVFSLYNRALVLVGSDNDTVCSPRNEATVSGVLLFNMALCYHIQGLGRPEDHHKLEKALQFYQAAASIIGLNHNLCGADRLIYLAIYNNQAQIFSNLFCEEEVQQCLSWLQEGLECSAAEGDAEDDLVSNDLIDIHLNVALFHGSRAHAPAA
jgi:tetratricopeptide (TPR) repeat protein